jgi:hypothetical protein
MSIKLTKTERRNEVRRRLLPRAAHYLLLAACYLILVAAIPSTSSAGVFISVGFAPPALPVYVQPVCPTVGWLWTPGYWAYNEEGGYYWVPGTWAAPPQVGLLWTPPYWGWNAGAFVFNAGYWGPTVGFYGGINYGFGFGGVGFEGGEWRNGAFFYNRSVTNVTNVTNVYNKTVINNTTINNVSYNGGTGGTTAHPTPEQEAYAHQEHVQPTPAQMQHEQAAASNPQLRAAVNHGRPAIAATAKPGDFKTGVVAAKPVGKPYNPPKPSGATAAHANAAAPKPGGEAARPASNVPRPPTASHTESAPHAASVPHPPSTPHTESAPRASTPRPPTTPRPESAPRAESAPRPAPAPHAESAPHAAPAPHAVPAQHAAPAPHAAPAHAAPPPREEEKKK